MLKLTTTYLIAVMAVCFDAGTHLYAQDFGAPVRDQALDLSPPDDSELFDTRPDDSELTYEPVQRPRLRETFATPRSNQTQPIRGAYDAPRPQHARAVMAQPRTLTKVERARFEEIGSLRNEIREEKDEKKRAELGETLRTKLGVIFDDDLSERDEELKKLEERVEKLRAAVEKRRKNRDRVITLQVDSVMLAAEGLAFPAIQPEAATTRNGEWELYRPVPVQNAARGRFDQPALPPRTTSPRNRFNRN